MPRKRFLRFFALCLFAALFSAAPALRAQTEEAKTSTPEERQGWAEALHQMEASPNDPAANARAEQAVKRIIAVNDFHVALCGPVFTDFTQSHYTFKSEMLRVYLLGTATYQIETSKSDAAGTNLYALQAVLKAYGNLLQVNPKAHDKKLDNLQQLSDQGKLADYVAKQKCS